MARKEVVVKAPTMVVGKADEVKAGSKVCK